MLMSRNASLPVVILSLRQRGNRRPGEITTAKYPSGLRHVLRRNPIEFTCVREVALSRAGNASRCTDSGFRRNIFHS